MADTETTIPFIDGALTPRQQLSIVDAETAVAPQTTIRANEAIVSDANEFPVKDAAALTRLEAIAGSAAASATAGNQATEIAALTAIQTAAGITAAGGATAALQTAGNASLTTIATNTGAGATAAGQATGNTSAATTATQTTATATATGTQADVAWVSGNGTVISLLKSIRGAFSSVIATVTGSVTANAGTNLNTSALTLEAGNAATTATNTGAISTTTGTVSDAAWVSGNGTLVALLKSIRAAFGSVVATVSGSVTANAGTNLNTSSLALETGGNLGSTATNTAAISTATGTIADAAWSGSGSGTLSAVGKAIWTALTGYLNTAPTIGNAVTPFAVTTGDQPITGLTLPGKIRITYPAYQLGTTTPNAGQIQISYAGGNSVSAPTAALLPGAIDDWLHIAGSTAPHVSITTGTATILIQQ